MADSVLDQEKFARALRTKRGTTSLEAVAADTGVDVDTLRQLEQGTHEPSLKTFAALCDWMRISMDYFLADGDAPESVTA